MASRTFRSREDPRRRASLGIGTAPSVTSINPNAGRVAGGLSVTLTGTNFKNQNDGTPPIVLLGGVAATSVVVVGPTTITFVTPVVVSSGVVDVTVTIDSQADTLLDAFTYVTSFIVSVAPKFGPLAGGTSVEIVGNNFVAGSTVKFGTSAATGVVVIDSEHIKAVAPNHALGFVDVTVTEPGLATSVLRNGFQYTLLVRGNDIRRNPGIVIRNVLGSSSNTCSFVIDGRSHAPEGSERVVITDGFDNDRLLFAGSVRSADQVYEGLANQLAWDVKCTDDVWLMNRRRPFGSYVRVSASSIVTDLVARYAPWITVNHVQTRLAKVTIVLDGSRTISEVFDAIKKMIGGGRWNLDYTGDLHFFHVVPPNLVVPLPPSLMPDFTTWMTVSEGAAIPSTFGYNPGYLVFRHAFVYSDGSRSSLQNISNVLRVTGDKILSFVNVPTGAAVGSLTVVAREIYYNEFIAPTLGDSPIEDIRPFVTVNDNVTTSFTTWWGTTGASSPAIISVGIAKTFTTPGVGTPPGYVQLSDQAATLNLRGQHSNGRYGLGMTRGWAGYKGATFLGEGNWPPVGVYGDGNVVYFATPGVATFLENASSGVQVPAKAFSGHPAGPDTSPSAFIDLLYSPALNNGISVQFKTAYLYRDGSISFTGPPSDTATQIPTHGAGVKGFDLLNVQVGPSIGTLDVVARIIYHAVAELADPNFSVDRTLRPGEVWPVGFKDVTWDSPGQGIVVVPDNVTTELLNFSLGDLDSPLLAPLGYHPGMLVGRGNLPFQGDVLSSDPIPLWPNPDGPSLEDVDPPADLTNANLDLLREPYQQFQVSFDESQIRNRIFVLGSGSIATKTASIGSTEIFVADVSNFSPTGGKVKIEDAAKNLSVIVGYLGVQGVVGAASIALKERLPYRIAQGSVVTNFFQADDLESQKYFAKKELDVNGNPTDGVHEYTVPDGSLKAVFQLYMRAHAELELFAWPIRTITYATHDPKSVIGQTVHVDMQNPPCFGDFLIQEVTISQIRSDGPELKPVYTVTASSLRFELEDLLLQILDNQGRASGTSGAGIVQAGISQAGTGEFIHSPPAKSFGGSVANGAGSALLPTGEIASVATGTGTASAVVDAEVGAFRRFTNTTADGLAGFNAAVNTAAGAAGQIFLLPTVEFLFRTGSILSNVRYYAGLVSGSGPSQGNTGSGDNVDGAFFLSGSAIDFFGVVKRAGQTVWEFGTSTNATNLSTFTRIGESGFVVQPSTVYRVRLTVLSTTTVLVTVSDSNGNEESGYFDFPVWTGATSLQSGVTIGINASVNTQFFDFASFSWERSHVSRVPSMPEV